MNLPRRRGVAVEQVDRGHRQQLGRRQITVLGSLTRRSAKWAWPSAATI
jgi:hypothetical protein